jgi:membrane-associated phospholipid phosphatase
MVSRRTRALLLAWAGLITLSTIHTGNHYGIDAAAGVLLAASVHLVAVRVRQDRVRQAQLRQFRVRQARVVVPKEVLS